MKKWHLALMLSILAVLLTASSTMAAPRAVATKATDLHFNIAPSGLGIVVDFHSPSSNGRGLRVSLDGAFYFEDHFGAGVSAAYVYPLNPQDPFKVALFGGIQGGLGEWSGYVPVVYIGGVAGFAFQANINNDLTLTGEITYAPAVGMHPNWTGYVFHGGYGLYLIYDVRSDLTINAGIRSLGWMPGLFIGFSF
ncbi:MAG TPA: hypothetical protein DF292_00800 [Firmicutes bacterium]|jgi:hypothetical protein|nr:hypothetical protein [Bacillota bacterium]